jgi:3-methyladenine DNA glycosylase AlkD
VIAKKTDDMSIGQRADEILAALKGSADARVLSEMGPRYGIHTDKALGVPMAAMQRIAKPLAPGHGLAEALWGTGWYEARIVACLIDDPALVTPEQMDRWRGDFDNWAIVDTVCFKLFDQVPGAFAKVEQWTGLNDEFGRRAGFALLASMALHGHGTAADMQRGLHLIEQASGDGRNFVRKAVNWALRAIGSRKDKALKAAARELATRLSLSSDRTAQWIGKDAARAFAKADAAKSRAQDCQ